MALETIPGAESQTSPTSQPARSPTSSPSRVQRKAALRGKDYATQMRALTPVQQKAAAQRALASRTST